jgi:hypothetical protein
LGTLNLDRSRVAGIRGSGAKFAGSVFLQDGFVAEDAVLLDWAYISGSLNCTNGKFTNPQGAALSCRGATIAGDMLLQAVVSEGIVKSSEPPGGMGETGTSAIVPAIGNAIFAATGKRLRKMPVDSSVLRQPA